mmetsp:Transcript_9446/g.22567  ORF Transcript_9446/g.22567 Transcript_9446/m.22567 type:complete len:401 (-) Transcript_9446:223-1425(-)
MAEPKFQKHDRVRFRGLVKSTDDNGKQGTVVEYDAKLGKYSVLVNWRDKSYKVKEENLEKVSEDAVPKAPVVPERSPSSAKGEGEASQKRAKRSRSKRRSRSRSKSRSRRRRSRSRSKRRSVRSRSRSRSPRSRRRRSRSPAKEEVARTSVASTAPPAATAVLGQVATPSAFQEKGDRKGGKGGKGKGKGSGKDRTTQISKALARVLRHTAASQGIQIRADGFCSLEDLLKLQDFTSLSCNAEEVKVAVASNDKKRFEISEESGKVFVRAVQGHSMKAVADESLLSRLGAADADLPTVCVHGTYRRNLESIRRSGLIAGGGVSERNHIHFAPFEPHDGRVISGMRYNCEVAIYIDLRAAIQNGIPFFRSANQVILSPGKDGVLPAAFISQIKDLQTGALL